MLIKYWDTNSIKGGVIKQGGERLLQINWS